jgi:hypothetical protein
VNDIIIVKVVDSFEYLTNSLRGILFSESSLFADSIEQLSSRCKLCDDIVFVLEHLSTMLLFPRSRSSHPGLEPIHKFDNMRVFHPLEHFEFIVNHLLVAFYILLEDNLYGDLSSGTFCFSDDTVGTRPQGFSKPVS